MNEMRAIPLPPEGGSPQAAAPSHNKKGGAQHHPGRSYFRHQRHVVLFARSAGSRRSTVPQCARVQSR